MEQKVGKKKMFPSGSHLTCLTTQGGVQFFDHYSTRVAVKPALAVTASEWVWRKDSLAGINNACLCLTPSASMSGMVSKAACGKI